MKYLFCSSNIVLLGGTWVINQSRELRCSYDTCFLSQIPEILPLGEVAYGNIWIIRNTILLSLLSNTNDGYNNNISTNDLVLIL